MYTVKYVSFETEGHGMDMKEVLEQMRGVFELMASEEFTESVASFCWNLYTKLKARGFTDEQAIRIVSSMSKQGK